MDWEFSLVLVAFGVFLFLMTGLENVVKTIMTNKVKIAEANARTEEARLEQKRLEAQRRTSA